MGCARAMFFDRSPPFLVVVLVLVLVLLLLSLLPCRRLSELTMPVHQTAVGKEAKKWTNVFKKTGVERSATLRTSNVSRNGPGNGRTIATERKRSKGKWWWCCGVVVVRCGSPLFLLFSVLVCQLILLSVVYPPPRPTKGRSVARHVVRVEKTNRFGKGNLGKDSERVSSKFWRQRGHQQRSQKW